MARIGTPILNLGTYTDGEDPGAGSQTVDSLGLNGDKIKIDKAIGTEHNPDGTHKNAVIDGANLKSNVADGSTIEQDSSTKKLKIKNAGVTYAKIQNVSAVNKLLGRKSSGEGSIEEISIDGVTLEIDAGAGLQAKDGGIGTDQMANNGVTSAKLDPNSTRTKMIVCFAHAGTVSTYFKVGDISMAATFGPCFGRSGSITGITVVEDTGAILTNDKYNYDVKTFGATDRITIYHNADDALEIRKNGASWFSVNIDSSTQSIMLTMELTFD